MFILFSNASHAFTQIGAPNDLKLRPEGSEMVLVQLKVVECFKNRAEAVAILEKETGLSPSVACGSGVAHVLLNERFSMLAGEDKHIEKPVNLPYFEYESEVYTEKANFKVKPKMVRKVAQKNDEILLSLSKVIEGHVKASLAVEVQSIRLTEEEAYLEGEEGYIHQKPVVQKRVMTASETLKIGEEKPLSGQMWVEGYTKEKGVLPEHSRLWVELVIK